MIVENPTQREDEGAEGRQTLRRELASVLNRHSLEEGSNTPDFILADYLLGCLDSFDRCTRAREKWYGIKSIPAHGTVHLDREVEGR